MCVCVCVCFNEKIKFGLFDATWQQNCVFAIYHCMMESLMRDSLVSGPPLLKLSPSYCHVSELAKDHPSFRMLKLSPSYCHVNDLLARNHPSFRKLKLSPSYCHVNDLLARNHPSFRMLKLSLPVVM